MNITEYLESRGLTQAEFARMQDASPQQVTKWIDKGFIIVNGRLYSPRREIKEASFPLMPEIKDTPEARAVLKRLGLDYLEPERFLVPSERLKKLLSEMSESVTLSK